MLIHNIWEWQPALSSPFSKMFAGLRVPVLKNEIWFREGFAGRGCCDSEGRSAGTGAAGVNWGGRGEAVGQSWLPLWQPSLSTELFKAGVRWGCEGAVLRAHWFLDTLLCKVTAGMCSVAANRACIWSHNPNGNSLFSFRKSLTSSSCQLLLVVKRDFFFCIALHASLFLFASSFPFLSHLFPNPFFLPSLTQPCRKKLMNNF